VPAVRVCSECYIRVDVSVTKELVGTAPTQTVCMVRGCCPTCHYTNIAMSDGVLLFMD